MERLIDEAGSPPHARGGDRRARRTRTSERITPACAGRRGRGSSRCTTPGDHPRMRGEEVTGEEDIPGRSGSPPHARGGGTGLQAASRSCRITPACAGRSGPPAPGRTGRPDHPRMRGEEATIGPSRNRAVGSPPHARGGGQTVRVRPMTLRITPACAGRSCSARRYSGAASDHPRMRGEEGSRASVIVPKRGSPPHARGGVVRRSDLLPRERITPACAGKSRLSRGPRIRPTDHPRMRGEERIAVSIWSDDDGSPPHARGRADPDSLRQKEGRITPACAGKRPTASGSTATCADHPRMRGEEIASYVCPRCRRGSPPHARGRVLAAGAAIGAARITPACAGKRPR
mgnify:FL=1